MAGHSKFKNIQYRKGAQDKKRSSMFAKFSKEITVAAKMGGTDMDSNPRLRLAVTNARSNSMPKDNIERAITKSEASDTSSWDEIRYEGYAPGGTALIVECLTDNKFRAASDVRATFSKSGGNLGETGSVSFQFNHVGEFIFDASVKSADEMFELALDAGAEDVVSDDETHEIFCQVTDFHSVMTALVAAVGSEPKSAKLVWKAENPIEVDFETAEKIMKMVDKLEDLDDVQNIYGNYEFSEEVMEKLAEL